MASQSSEFQVAKYIENDLRIEVRRLYSGGLASEGARATLLEQEREATREAELARARVEASRQHMDDLCVQEIGIDASAALAAVGLSGWEDHSSAELSGGQQQRVAIARALVTEPAVLLADEPTGNLDTARSLEIMELLSRFNREQGITIVMVTHEAEMAAFARQVVHFLDGRVGRGHPGEDG